MSQLRQRQPRVEDPKFLAFVRGYSCCVCGNPNRSQAAHIRMGNLAIGKRAVGIGERPDDRWSVPMCNACHLNDQHRTGERRYWAIVHIDPFAVAQRLYAEYQDSRRK